MEPGGFNALKCGIAAAGSERAAQPTPLPDAHLGREVDLSRASHKEAQSVAHLVSLAHDQAARGVYEISKKQGDMTHTSWTSPRGVWSHALLIRFGDRRQW